MAFLPTFVVFYFFNEILHYMFIHFALSSIKGLFYCLFEQQILLPINFYGTGYNSLSDKNHFSSYLTCNAVLLTRCLLGPYLLYFISKNYCTVIPLDENIHQWYFNVHWTISYQIFLKCDNFTYLQYQLA